MLRRFGRIVVLLAAGAVAALVPDRSSGQGGSLPEWSVNVSVIEGCTCPMFCPGYFNTRPAAQADSLSGATKYYCRFNSAFRVNQGKYGKVVLDGALFWLAGDRGVDWTKGEMDWALLTFHRPMPDDQREAIAAIVGFLYRSPVRFKSVDLSEGDITWTGGQDEAAATLEGGKSAEVRLKRFPSMGPVLVQDARYWGATRNDGFRLMPASVQAYRIGRRPFESRDSSGFTTTFDLSSADLAASGSP